MKLTRFGLVETVVAVCERSGSSEPDDLRLLGADIVQFAKDGKSKIPLGLGCSLVVYPVLLVDEASSELRQFAGSYTPKHWCVMEFPVVVERSTRSLVMLGHVPLWGAAYFRKTRRDAQELLAADMTSRAVLAGECQCGAVRYAVADEFIYAANCHCSGCRAATGSAFKAFAGIEREKLGSRRVRTSFS